MQELAGYVGGMATKKDTAGISVPGGNLILPVYGYQPVMVSAQCLRQTNKACIMEEASSSRMAFGSSKAIFLKDRMNKEFPVLLHCDRCENTIYNTVPLSLHKDMERAAKIGAGSFLYSFTIDKGPDLRSILEFYLAGGAKGRVPSCLKEFTRGHFIKGVD